MKKNLFLLVLSLLIVNLSLAQIKPLPSLKVKNLNGKTVDLKKYADNGKITIMAFWATWCSPCKKEISNMNDLMDEWSEKYGAELVAVSIDDARNTSKVKPYVNGKGWEFDVLLDVNGDAKRGLNFPTVPYLILIDKDGNIVYKHSGYVEGDEFELEDKIKEITK